MEFLYFSFLILTAGVGYLFKLYLDGRKEAKELKNTIKQLKLSQNEEGENRDNKVYFISLVFLKIES